MSADNWRVCPKCKKKNDRANENRILYVAEQYGKVPAEKYIALAKAASKPIEIEEAFREDFDIGINEDGTFSICYTGSCQECGARFHYEFEDKSAIVEIEP